jgi:hypothetical protein
MTGVLGGGFQMLRLKPIMAGAALAAALAAGQAQAATWLLTYTSTTGAPLSANLTLQASDVMNAVGGFDALGISGAVDGDTITGLIANPSQPLAHYSADGMFIYDNVVWPTGAPALSNPGLFFSGASGNEYNLFSDNATTYELYRARSGVGYLANSVGTLSVAEQVRSLSDSRAGAIPEPGTWLLMIIGFGSIGAALRIRRRPAPIA